MPFRDRVARRFGETVSAPQFELDSDDSGTVAELAFATPAISFSQTSSPFHNRSPCCSPPASDSLSSLDDDSNVYKQESSFHSAAAKKRVFMHKALGPQHHKTGSKIIKAQAKTAADEPGTRCRLRPRGISSRRPSTPTASSSSPVPSSSSPLSSSRNSSPAPGRRVTRSRARPSSSVSRTSTSPASSEDSLLDEFNELFGGGRSACGRGTRFSSRRVYTDARGNQLSPTSPYLSYHDVCLTFEDIKALRSDWLTDNNIAFWEEWLEREILPKYPQARICLLRPSMTYLLMRDQNPRQLRPVLPDMTKVTHVFLPINDAASRTQPDGSHWSLLLVSKLDGVAFHYDSLGGANNMDGERATTQLSKLLGMQLRYQAINDCPQQENGNDCGVFVCILMRHLLVKRLLNANAREKVSMSMSNKMIDSNGARKEMIKIIESLRKEGERRRSASPFAKSEGAPRID